MMSSLRPALFCASFAVATLGVACSAEAAAPPSTPPGATTTPAPVASTPAALVPAGPRGVVLVRYEALRAALADDNAALAAADLDALRTAVAALVADKVAGAADLDRGTAALASAAGDTKAARLAFGELSRGVVAVIAADPALQAGRFLFECPMARGYQRWVQTTPDMKNPYMGKRMLECGSPIAAWRVEG